MRVKTFRNGLGVVACSRRFGGMSANWSCDSSLILAETGLVRASFRGVAKIEGACYC